MTPQRRRTADNVDLMVEINRIISEYVQIERAAEGIIPSRQFDISKIDFDLLRREFAQAKKKNLILKDLQDLVCERLDRMLLNNPSRIRFDLLQKFDRHLLEFLNICLGEFFREQHIVVSGNH